MTDINPYDQDKINNWAGDVLSFLESIKKENEAANDLYNKAPHVLHMISEDNLAELERINRLFKKYAPT